MSNGLKLLLIAASAIIVCIVCVVGFNVTKEGKSSVNASTEQFNSVTNRYGDVELKTYDGLAVSGREVETAIRDHKDMIEASTLSILVKTNKNAAGYEYHNTLTYPSIDINTKKESATTSDYINPTGKFLGSIHLNKNGVIDQIIFTQE